MVPSRRDGVKGRDSLESVAARGDHPGTTPVAEAPVITEVVTVKLLAGMTREDVAATDRKTVPIWGATPERIR
jgi:hypothetical protein